jgi:hypothetical protein
MKRHKNIWPSKRTDPKGTKYLGLTSGEVYVNPHQSIKPYFPNTNELEYLDLTGVCMEVDYFTQLIMSCHKLVKLSIDGMQIDTIDVQIG